MAIKSAKHYRGVKRRNQRHRDKPGSAEADRLSTAEFDKLRKVLKIIFTPNTGFDILEDFLKIVHQQQTSMSEEGRKAIEHYVRYMKSRQIP